MIRKNNKNNKKFLWEYPWRYRESFLIAMELLIIGFIIEIIARGKGLVLLHWPVNLIAGSCFILLLIIFFIYFKNTKFLKWLSSVPTAISAICLFCFLSLLLGFLPQYPQERLNLISLIGLNHIQRSWPFLISEIYLLIVLGFVILRRLNPFNWKNIGFFINHAGLWITLFSITLGSGDLLRLKLKLIENENPKDMVVDDQLRLYRLPFQVKLIDFDIEEYPPKVALIDRKTTKFIKEATNNLILIEEGLKIAINDWEVEVKKYLYSSKKKDSIFVESNEFGARASAYLIARNIKNGEIKEGWVAPAILAQHFECLNLDNEYSLALTIPEPKVYCSLIEIHDDGTVIDTVQIKVNKPYSLKSWKLYQLSYDQRMGRWSPISILEVVYDPWLPVIYSGFFMLIAGAMYMLWIGKDK